MNRRGFLKVLGLTGAAITAAPTISQYKTKDEGDGTFIFKSNGHERFRIDSSGNLGIGVTASKWNTRL